MENSPVLTEEDLLEIITSAPVQGALSAISRRTNVVETVSHAIATSDDNCAIAELLANPSAQIREETLDRLVDNAASVTSWHAPLVDRPELPANAAQRIAGFVADSLLDTLRRRTDLTEQVVDAIEIAVNERLKIDGENEPKDQKASGISGMARPEGDEKDDAYERALILKTEGRLTETLIHNAAAAGDRETVIASLAACSGLSCASVNNIFEMRASKGIVAICWKSGMSMELAYSLQITIGAIAPGAILASDGNANFPLSEKELHWQIEFFDT